MQLPSIKKILREDVKDAPPWISGIIEPFNSFAETIYQALNRNITFSQNINSFIKEISYKTTAAYPTADQISFTNELKMRATGVLVLQAYDRLNYAPAPGPYCAPWIESAGQIFVNSITGLEASKSYTIRLLVI